MTNPVTDLDRVRFVTARYAQLRGLHGFAWGALMSAYLAGAWWFGVPTGHSQDSLDGFVFLLAVCLPAGFAQAYLKEYYERRFGRVGSVEEVSWDAGMLIAIGLAVVMLLLEATGTIRILVAAWAGFHGWIAIRDFRYRPHHLLIPVIAVAFWAAGQGPGPLPPGFDLLLMLAFSSAMAVVGLLDHRLLQQTLIRARRADLCETTRP